MTDESGKKKTVPANVTVAVAVSDENVISFDDYEPSVTLSVFVYWILPILVISGMSRFLVDPLATTGLGLNDIPDPDLVPGQPPIIKPIPQPTVMSPTPVPPPKKPVPLPLHVVDKPTSYKDAIKAISRRRLDWEKTDASTMTGYGDEGDSSSDFTAETTDSPPPKAQPPNKQHSGYGASTDPVRNMKMAKIDELRDAHQVCVPFAERHLETLHRIRPISGATNLPHQFVS